MDLEQYFNGIWKLEREIEIMNQEKREYMELATKMTSSVGDERVQTSSGGDKTGTIAVKIADKSMEIVAAIHRLAQYKESVSSYIKLLNNMEYRKILTMRYVRSMSVQDVADSLGYSRRTVYRKQKDALEEMQEIVNMKNMWLKK